MEKTDDLKEQTTYYLRRRTYANMRIALCDDDRDFLDRLKNHIYDYSREHRYETVVDEFISGEDLLDSPDGYNIIFMDYKMGGMDGLETARRLRRKNINCVIIFLTSYPEIMRDTFEVATFRFLDKPLNMEKFKAALDGYFESFGNDYPIRLIIDREIRCIETKDIVSIESKRKVCIINVYNKDRQIEPLRCAKTMKAVFELMPKHFCRVHNSFVVNMNYIELVRRGEIFLVTGQILSTSRHYHAQFKIDHKRYIDSKNIW